MSEIQTALDRTKIQLMRIPNTVFYYTLLFSLKQEFVEDVPTAATDGISIFINPSFFLGLSEKERMGVVIHEIMHVALNHMTRIGSRNPKLWNIAGDYVINAAIRKEEHYILPADHLYESKFENMSTEAVYKILYKEKQAKQQQPGKLDLSQISIPGGQDVKYPKDSKEAEKIEKDIISKVLKATIQAEAANELPGMLSSNVRRIIDESINPKLPWNIILQNYFTNFTKDDYSWRRPNRRFLPEFYLPSAYSESAGHIAIAVDTSGSVTLKQFSYFITEIATIQENLKPEKITIIDFDIQINNIHETEDYTEILTDLNFSGGGGTRIKPVFTWIEENEPSIILIFTDGYFSIPKDFPKQTDIIWLIHNNKKFKISTGEVIHYDIER